MKKSNDVYFSMSIETFDVKLVVKITEKQKKMEKFDFDWFITQISTIFFPSHEPSSFAKISEQMESVIYQFFFLSCRRSP